MDGPTTGPGTAAAGHTVGNRYTLGAAVGSGGMGTVWSAHDELLRRDVAVKEVLLPPGLPAAERQVLCERTLREARAAAALNHPAVVRVYDVVQDGERPWIVMELLEARSISEILRDDGPMPVRTVAEVGLAVLGALEAAHRVGVLHRDVKPGNVLIGSDGRTTLTDFGVARSANESPLTSTGLLLGSPQYIAPERARGQKFGPASDLWSLGATLYTAVEGRPPFDRGDPLPTMTAVVCEPPDQTAFAGPLEAILDGLLEKDPERRWDAARTRAALKAVLTGGNPVPALPAAAPAPTSPARSPISPARSGVSTARKAITSRLANAVAQRSPARALEGTAAMEAPSFTGAQPGLPITGDPAPARSVDTRTSAGAPQGNQNQPPRPQPPNQAGPQRSAPPVSSARPPASPPAAGPRAAGPPAGGPPAGGPPAAGPPAATQVLHGQSHGGTPRRAQYLASDEAMRASAAGHTSGIPRSRFGSLTQRQRWLVFAAVGLAIVLVAFGGTYLIAQSIGGPAMKNTWTNIGQAPAPAAPKVVQHTSNGMTVNVPAGWKLEWQTADRTRVRFFADPSKDVFLQLYAEKVGGTDQQRVWEAGERRQKKASADYARVADFAPSKIGDHDSLDWEWRFTAKSGQHRHVLVRGVIIDGTSYQLYYSAPEDRYASGVGVLAEAARSFRLTG